MGRELQIPPTAVGGLFRSFLQGVMGKRAPNPTHGSGWIVQIFSAVSHVKRARNPTHGSGWIVQILSTKKLWGRDLQIPPTGSYGQLVDCSDLFLEVVRNYRNVSRMLSHVLD